MFTQIITTLGQMDGKYQQKTKIFATVVRRKDVEYSKTSGNPGQSLLLRAENQEESWVKWIGNDVKDGALDTSAEGNQYEFSIWPFQPKDSPKVSLYCWMNRMVQAGAQQPAPQGQQSSQQLAQGQPANAQSAEQSVDWDGKQLREHRGHQLYNATLLVTKLAEIAGKTEGQNPGLIKEIAEELVQYIYNGPAARPTQPSGPNPDYVGDNPPPPKDDDIPF